MSWIFSVPWLVTLAAPPSDFTICFVGLPALSTAGWTSASSTSTSLPLMVAVPVASLVIVEVLRFEAVMVRVPPLAMDASPTEAPSNVALAAMAGSRFVNPVTSGNASSSSCENARPTEIALSPAVDPSAKVNSPPLRSAIVAVAALARSNVSPPPSITSIFA
ncbi:hypothetical protein PEP31012_04670 [Pandoraea eparura]|uniref:Uncharacterized protein n=1 Tax=Pandoraea eparura TaxID=2508291 RepID=A0A5E4YPA2_9BURK|nr:hypothetical protein PEP31012_04670 [Pandoraea eparura]